MAIDKRLLDILCCPATRQPVALLSSNQLVALNRAVQEGKVVQADGCVPTRSIEAGLITRDGRTVYRIEDGIPVMLVDQAIAVHPIEGFPA